MLRLFCHAAIDNNDDDDDDDDDFDEVVLLRGWCVINADDDIALH